MGYRWLTPTSSQIFRQRATIVNRSGIGLSNDRCLLSVLRWITYDLTMPAQIGSSMEQKNGGTRFYDSPQIFISFLQPRIHRRSNHDKNKIVELKMERGFDRNCSSLNQTRSRFSQCFTINVYPDLQ